jgi:hypothetical protein
LANCLTVWIGLGLFFVPGAAAFRILFGFQLLPGLCMLAGSPWMPESPRWLALTDRYEDCLAVLKRIHGNDQDDSDSFYAREFHQVRAQIEMEKNERIGIKDILTKASYRKRVLLIMAFYFFQQCVQSQVLKIRAEADKHYLGQLEFCHKRFTKCRSTQS